MLYIRFSGGVEIQFDNFYTLSKFSGNDKSRPFKSEIFIELAMEAPHNNNRSFDIESIATSTFTIMHHLLPKKSKNLKTNGCANNQHFNFITN
jgi:hypothetical protein